MAIDNYPVQFTTPAMTEENIYNYYLIITVDLSSTYHKNQKSDGESAQSATLKDRGK